MISSATVTRVRNTALVLCALVACASDARPESGERGSPAQDSGSAGEGNGSPGSEADGSDASDGAADDEAHGPMPALHVSGTRIVDAQGKEVILRGLGVGELYNIEAYFLQIEGDDLGGMGATKFERGLRAAIGDEATQAFFERWKANVVSGNDVDRWKSWGVNSLRVPLNYHQLTSAPGVYLEQGFAALDGLIALCKARGIYVILDLHAAPGAQNTELMSDSLDGVAHLWKEPAKYRQWTIDLWRTLAARYAGEPAVAGYDLLDEPFDDAESGSFAGDGASKILRPFYLDVTHAIREVDPEHILFVEGGDDWAKGFSGLEPAWDAQMVWTFHKYWDDNDEDSIAPFLALRERTQRPLWNGETGEDETRGWSKAMIALLESHGIGWNEWTYKKLAPSDTNPYSIPAPRGWDDMADYLAAHARGLPDAPPADARAIMEELADNAALERCTCNERWLHDVFGKSCD